MIIIVGLVGFFLTIMFLAWIFFLLVDSGKIKLK
jgi:hypothetical protein